jgi:hypothetical protein
MTVQQDMTLYSLLYFCKLPYVFWVVTPPIIRSKYNCNYIIWHWSECICCLALGPTQPPVQWVPGLSLEVKSGHSVMLTPHSLLVPFVIKE